MLLQSCIDCLLSCQYEMKWRACHSTKVNNHRLYSWGGKQEDLPMIHSNDDVDIFHLVGEEIYYSYSTCRSVQLCLY